MTDVVRRPTVPGVTRRSLLAAAAGLIPLPALAQAPPPRPRGGGSTVAPNIFYTDVPPHPLDVVSGRPTDRTVTLSLRADAPRLVHVAYGAGAGDLPLRTADLDLAAGMPAAHDLTGLEADARYFYEVRGEAGAPLHAGQFHTQRRPGSGFTFTVTGCSHLDAGTRLDIYQRTLANIVADRPDFHIDLGDAFMTEKYNAFRDAEAQYLAQRYWFGQVSTAAPVFLALGNHDGEYGFVRQAQKKAMPVWAAQMRTRHFPNPEPNGFYRGNPVALPGVGLLQNYYAFDWGDAQFIVLDPYWPTGERAGRDPSGWDMTLGREQYRWLTEALESSPARYRFVFIHHLIGGGGQDHRGGIESAPFYEWGGRDEDGRDTFAEHRPGWAMPVHQLLVKHGVGVVFHAHDHLYARQELDGIIYQEVPQPSHPENRVQNLAEEYGYRQGQILPSPGHMRVSVREAGATVEYVRAALPDDARSGKRNGRVDDSYEVPPHG